MRSLKIFQRNERLRDSLNKFSFSTASAGFREGPATTDSTE